MDDIDEVDPYIGKTFNQRYLVEIRLGRGAFGKVYFVRDKLSPKVNKYLINFNILFFHNLICLLESESPKAMKIMNWDKITANELDVLTKLDHENVVKYYAHFNFCVRGHGGNNRLKLAILT